MRILEIVSKPLNQTEIADREIAVNLLDSDFGFQLERNGWKPSAPKFTERWAERFLSDGRYLRSATAQNIIEKINVNLSADSHDGLSVAIKQLFDLANRARMYQTTDWYKTPVYLHAKLTDESHSRYALVRNLSVEFGQSLYAVPNDPGNFVENITLTIEREPFWRSSPPGALPISDIVLLNSLKRTSGATYANVAYVNNEKSTTTSYYAINYRQSTNTYANYNLSNVVSVLTFSVSGSTPAVGDIFYLGSATPWTSYICKLSLGGSGLTTVAEYFNGTAWTAVPIMNLWTSGNFPDVGVSYGTTGAVTFDSVDVAWQQTTVNGLQMYFVRWRITAVGASPFGGIFSSDWLPSTDDSVSYTAINGDADALTLLRVSPLTAMYYTFPPNRLICGLRTRYSADFSARIKTATVAGNWTFALQNNSTSAVDDSFHTANAVVPDFVLSAAHIQRASWTLDAAFSHKIAGEYQVYARVRQIGGAVGDITIGLQQHYNFGHLATLSTVSPRFVSPPLHEIVTLGKISIASALLENETNSKKISFHILAGRVAGSATLKIYELIFIPIDEWSAVLASADTNQFIHTGGLDVDAGILHSETAKHALNSDYTPAERIARWQTRGALPSFPAGRAGKISFLFLTAKTIGGHTGYVAPSVAMRVQMYAHNRYSLLRGDTE